MKWLPPTQGPTLKGCFGPPMWRHVSNTITTQVPQVVELAAAIKKRELILYRVVKEISKVKVLIVFELTDYIYQWIGY